MGKTLEARFNELDDMMKMYFKQETIIKAWNLGADKKNDEAKEFNATKMWYQRKRPDNFPHYHETPVRMPMLFPTPPSTHKQYKKTKKLIEDYSSTPSIEPKAKESNGITNKP
jgi:hypothetical protein